MTQKETDVLFNAITSNGCRDMDEVRFHQAINEAMQAKLSETPLSEVNTKHLYKGFPDMAAVIDDNFEAMAESEGTELVSDEDLMSVEIVTDMISDIRKFVNERHEERCKERAIEFAEYWAAEHDHPESVYLSASDAWEDWNETSEVKGKHLKCPNCKLDYDKEEIEMFRGLCESCRDRAF